MTSPAERTREIGIDVYRGLCVLVMFAVHAGRLQSSAPRTTASERLAQTALSASNLLEPYTLASFVFLAGISVVLASAERVPHDRARFSLAMTKRAGMLLTLSFLLFLAHYGYVWPDALVSSGLLGVIALGALLVTIALAASSPGRWLALFVVAGAVVAALLESNRVLVAGFSAGEGAVFPTMAFAPAGALCALGLRELRRPPLLWVQLAVAIVLLGALVTLQAKAPLIAYHTRLYPDYGTEAALAALVHGRLPAAHGTVSVSFWNHTALGFCGTVPVLAASAAALVALGRRLTGAQLLAPITLLGRHALFAYVCHLAMLGIASALGFEPTDALQTWLFVATLTLAILCAAKLLHARLTLKLPQRARS